MISTLKEFDNHKSIHIISEPAVQLKAFICIHRGDSIRPSFGATRFWQYHKEEDALNDALRLSRLMSSKAAHAGLKYGGAKAVIMEPQAPYDKKKLLKAYAHALNDLNGRFITGTDVGLLREDVLEMRRHSRFLVGIDIDPTTYTALGVIESVKAIFQHLYGNSSYQGKSFAIQGLGKIGFELLRLLTPHASKIYACDINEATLNIVRKEFPSVEIVAVQDIHKQSVDVFMPCALSGAINETSIHELNCKAISGAANNQLASPDIAEALLNKGILYAPDYITNAGGLISVVHEYEHQAIKETILLQQVEQIYHRLLSVFKESDESRTNTESIAQSLAQRHLSLFRYY